MRASILAVVANDERSGGDREADLRSIESTYREYDRAGRDRIWDLHVPGYARLVESLERPLMQHLRQAVASPMATVLDLGCGDGSLRRRAAGTGIRARWIGLDLREDAIETARREHPDATFFVGSADAVPLEGASVDVIVARLLFSSLPSSDMESAVAREIGRLLRPGGSLVWLDIRYSNPANRAVHGVSRTRLAALFAGWRIDVRTVGVLPPLARRLGRMTRIGFPVLESIRPLRSHLVGRLQPRATARVD